jgi:hypothetical protein
MNRNSVLMPKNNKEQNFEKVGVDFLFQKKIRNFLVYSLLMPDFV